MKRLALWVLLPVILTGCVHSLRLRSRDGEELTGRYRFSRGDSGLIQITGADGELLAGKFVRVGRSVFVASYEKTFGVGAITVNGPDLSPYVFGGLFGTSHAVTEVAYGETFTTFPDKSETAVRGPLFYWTASLGGDKGTILACYFIGSSYSGRGFGRCKSQTGKEYSAEF